MSKGLSEGRDLVCDRLYLGERIYGPILRGEDRLGDAKQRMLERALMGIAKTTQVICLPSFENVEAAWSRRPDEELVKTRWNIKKFYLAYKSVGSFLPTVSYFDWTKHSVEWLLTETVEIHSPANLGPGIGWWENTSVLVVGEQVNTTQPGPLLPFVGTGGSSLWLAERLEVDEQKIYWANARTPRGIDEDPGFINELDPVGIVALGSVASEWLHAHGYEHVRLNHPQYHKRFFHGEDYPLSEVVRDLYLQ